MNLPDRRLGEGLLSSPTVTGTQKERGVLSPKYLEMNKQDIKDGKTSNWGSYVGGRAGYAVCEGNKQKGTKYYQ